MKQYCSINFQKNILDYLASVTGITIKKLKVKMTIEKNYSNKKVLTCLEVVSGASTHSGCMTFLYNKSKQTKQGQGHRGQLFPMIFLWCRPSIGLSLYCR